MTTSDTIDMTPAFPAPPIRRLRRSRSDRIGAGVAGGLGEYFGVDPVLFRVLFATAAFFGGAGVLGYLLAWAAIPEEGTERAAIDGWVTSLRRRRVPFWVVAVFGALAFWVVAFSWWAPGPFFPVIAVLIVLGAIFGRRSGRVPAEPEPKVSLQKPESAGAPRDARPEWVSETRRWMHESRAARRVRSRRAFPVRITTLLVLAATLITLALIDAVRGIYLPVYFWFALAILSAGLLVGIALRRTPWSISILLIPTVLGLVAFGGTRVSAHDGSGQRDWTPKATLAAHYKLAFGRATLDLRSLTAQDAPRVVHINQGAGQLKIIAPKTMALTVNASVHIGVITLDNEAPRDGDGGLGVERTVEPLAVATGEPITIDVHLADGRVD